MDTDVKEATSIVLSIIYFTMMCLSVIIGFAVGWKKAKAKRKAQG